MQGSSKTRIRVKRIIFYQQKRKNVTFAPLNLSVAELVEQSDLSREGHSKEMRWGNKRNLSVAQLVEQLTLNQWVTGSNPVGETNKG